VVLSQHIETINEGFRDCGTLKIMNDCDPPHADNIYISYKNHINYPLQLNKAINYGLLIFYRYQKLLKPIVNGIDDDISFHGSQGKLSNALHRSLVMLRLHSHYGLIKRYSFRRLATSHHDQNRKHRVAVQAPALDFINNSKDLENQ
jgi:hypothetical protein